jgi:hypothetical protein
MKKRMAVAVLAGAHHRAERDVCTNAMDMRLVPLL